MPDATEIQTWARTYGPALDALQTALEDEIGPLLWDDRTDPATVARRNGSTAVRIGAIHAIGVPLPRLDLDSLGTAVNQVLISSGFPEQPPMTGSTSGHLVCEAVDPYQAELTLLIKDSVDAWVEVPA